MQNALNNILAALETDYANARKRIRDIAKAELAAFLAKRESSHGWGEPSDYVMGYLPNGGFVFVDKRGV